MIMYRKSLLKKIALHDESEKRQHANPRIQKTFFLFCTLLIFYQTQKYTHIKYEPRTVTLK